MRVDMTRRCRVTTARGSVGFGDHPDGGTRAKLWRPVSRTLRKANETTEKKGRQKMTRQMTEEICGDYSQSRLPNHT